MEKTFRTNFFSIFYLTKLALSHLKPGSAIINASSLTAYEGNEQLIDYSATKGAIVAFTRSLSKSLHNKGIRANGVVPGTIWTPLIPASFPSDQVANWGAKNPMKRAGQPFEIIGLFLSFLILAPQPYYLHTYSTFEQLEKDINTYIQFYNNELLQAKLNGLGPMEFRTKAA